MAAPLANDLPSDSRALPVRACDAGIPSSIMVLESVVAVEGGRLIAWYLTFGHHDWLVIAEFPDEKAAASAILAAAAGGSLSEIETTVAMTAKDAHATVESAGKAAKGAPGARRFGRDLNPIPPECRAFAWKASCRSVSTPPVAGDLARRG